jgi:Zn-dependent protease with chaperone function
VDFFEHQERARRKTFLLVIYFVLAVVGVVLAVYFATIGILALTQLKSDAPIQLPVKLWMPEVFAIATGATLLVVFFGSVYKIASIGNSGENVALSLGGRKLPADTRNLSERILLNVVEEMALASGTPVPPVYLLDEEGINAFAAGTSPQNAVIGVTRGAIETLSRDELQGVIAHEFSHILNGDMRLNIRLMGWLHGILVIALIGNMIVRALSRTRPSSNSSKNKNGGLIFAIFLGGLALIAIGYVGVFFAKLIKAAVSREREFLADSSAVQFTRNPSGIANALKKIGGWKEGSQIRSIEAEEASHMFFANGLVSNLFATHPPLLERVKRIEPQFSGPFTTTQSLVQTGVEIGDPQSLATQITSGLHPAHASAVEGAQRISEQPALLVKSVGEPREAHIEYVHGLVDELDQRLTENVRDPLGAVAVIYALLLAPKGSQFRAAQVELLKREGNQRVLAELNRVYSSVNALAAEKRLPVACLALPSLHQMSPPQLLEFGNVVKGLIQADRQISLFEFAVQRFINKRLMTRLQGSQAKVMRVKSISECRDAFEIVLSTLANYGNPKNPHASFAAGAQLLPGNVKQLSLLSSDQCTNKRLDQALDRLESASPAAKKIMLASFSACIAFDHKMSVEEAEILRVIADALGCPVPPVL